jgi:pilus assembly protein CpaB
MSRRRRAAALLGLAALLGVLAASDVAGREAALRRRLGPVVRVIVVRESLRPGDRITADVLGLRRVPEAYAPAGALRDGGAALGRRVAVAVDRGADLDPSMLAVPGPGRAPTDAAALHGAERALDVVGLATPGAVVPGARVDVLVTYPAPGDAPGLSRLVLRGAEVLTGQPVPAVEGQDSTSGLPRVRATLRVGAGQASALASALSAAAAVRLLARPAG